MSRSNIIIKNIFFIDADDIVFGQTIAFAVWKKQNNISKSDS